MANGVVTNSEGIMELAELTMDELNELMSDQRQKGIYKEVILDFVKTGNVYTVLNNDPRIKGREQSAIVQSINGNLDKLYEKDQTFPTCRLLKKGDNTILVNIAAHTAALEAEAAKVAE